MQNLHGGISEKVIWMAAFSVWAPVTFSKALIKFSKELLKNFWPKKDFFIATWFLKKFIIATWCFGSEKMIVQHVNSKFNKGLTKSNKDLFSSKIMVVNLEYYYCALVFNC